MALDVDGLARRPPGKQILPARVVLRNAQHGPRPVALGPAAHERGGARWSGVGPIRSVGQTDTPACERIQVGREPPPAEISDAIRPHRVDRLAAVIDHSEVQARDRERALEQVEAGPAVPLGPRHRRRAHTGGARQLALAEVCAPAGSPQRAGHVEGSGHGPSLERCQWDR